MADGKTIRKRAGPACRTRPDSHKTLIMGVPPTEEVFKIVSADAATDVYGRFNEVYSNADEKLLEKMTAQLTATSHWFVRLDSATDASQNKPSNFNNTAMDTSLNKPFHKKVSYVFSDDEESVLDIYQTDEDEEYQPSERSCWNDDSSSASPNTSLATLQHPLSPYERSRSKNGSSAKSAKRRLIFEPTSTSNASCSSPSMSSPTSDAVSECLPSIFRSFANYNVNGTCFVFDLNTRSVNMNVKMVLHTGTYEFNLVKDKHRMYGFIVGQLPDRYHECCHKTQSQNTYAVLTRKLNEMVASLKVALCTPLGSFVGTEFTIDDNATTIVPFSVLNKLEKNQSAAEISPKKKHCCLFCRQQFVEITTHLYNCHKDEKEIADIMAMPKGSKEKILRLKTLRLQGDNVFNEQVPLERRIPVRKFGNNSMENSVKCPSCLGVMSSRNFSRHEKFCTGRPPNRRQVLKEAKMLQRLSYSSKHNLKMENRLLEELLQPILLGEIHQVIRSDRCLILLSKKYAFMHRGSQTALKNDRQHLRRLARLLLIIRDIDSTIIDYEDLFVYASYDTFIEAIYKMCHLDEQTGKFGKAALAKTLKSLVTALLDVLEKYYIEQNFDKDSIEMVGIGRFRSLHDESYGTYVGKVAHRNTLLRKASKQNVLPSPEDVKKFVMYLEEEAHDAYRKLSEKFSYEEWIRLGKAVLVKIIVFNRRRVSEVGSMLMEFYQAKVGITDEQKSSLSVLERTIADTYKIMTLIGKRQHILHVLLNEDQCRQLDLFLKHRGDAGVALDNQFLFGLSNGLYIDASAALRDLSTKCGAQKPNLLRSTYLRKQVATLAQLLTMNDNEIAQVAKLMGHSQKVHEAVYRQDAQLFQVTAWAKFLTVVNETDINKYKGKSFDDIVNEANALNDIDDFPENNDHLYLEEQEASVDENEAENQNEDKASSAKNPLSEPQAKRLRIASVDKTSTPKKHKRRVLTPKKASRSPKKVPTPVKVLSPLLPKRRTRKQFLSKEVELMTTKFADYLREGRLVPQLMCDELVTEYKDVFVGRVGRDLYNWVQYQRLRNSRR